MQRLRHARFLARLVLAWFALSLGAAIAAPLLHPTSVQWVCSGSGAMVLKAMGGDDTGDAPAPLALDCPLCASVAPPPPGADPAAALLPLGQVLQPVTAARHAARLATAPPARGPPALS